MSYFGYDLVALKSFHRVIKGGVVTDLPVMPGGYEPTTAFAGSLDTPCVDDDGNVTFRAETSQSGKRVWKMHHYAFMAGTYTALPMNDQAAFAVACQGGKVLLGDDSASSGTEQANTVQAYTWAQGDAALTALPAVPVGNCVGCNVTDTDWKGRVLYDRGLLNGASYTLSTSDTFKARRLLPDGTVAGHHNGGPLASWTPGTDAVTLPGQPAPGMILLDVNDHGDLLAVSQDRTTKKVSVWLRKGTTWTAVDLHVQRSVRGLRRPDERRTVPREGHHLHGALPQPRPLLRGGSQGAERRAAPGCSRSVPRPRMHMRVSSQPREEEVEP